MKLNKILLAGVMTLGVSVANADSGSVNFSGQVVDTPCSIDADSLDQNVPFGTIALGSLAPGASSPGKTFDIKLIGCDTTTVNTAEITFNGDAGHGDTFGVKGGAKNIGILITGAQGPIAPGGSDTRTLVDGNNPLRYEAAVVADPAGETDPLKAVTAGNFTSVANFNIAYQ
ncbi:fimbrial protein [Acinetobacter vivianii]|uniref:Fimbrial protein n=1 Tax=Acinetobacter vivianii TaxID=1776742 RepID=A0AAJ6NK07_9GAMM|nr:fimbrial protein [Acinetobacter vivianii]WDZ51809.1 fimbrial protein [Acinetobacter vivianii]